VTNLRIFFVGGLISYRALFNWLNPWIFLPTLVVAPIFQVLFFAFPAAPPGSSPTGSS
jgi:ABC-2 type transport system permease protein